MTEIGTPDPKTPEIEIMPRVSPLPEPVELPERSPVPSEPEKVPA